MHCGKPTERIWAALKNYVANTAVSWAGRLRQIHSFFRARSPDEMLVTAAPWTSPWLPPGYEQNFWNAALVLNAPVPGHFLAGRAVVFPADRSLGHDQAGDGRPGPRVPHAPSAAVVCISARAGAPGVRWGPCR
jgi:hypothetical protein